MRDVTVLVPVINEEKALPGLLKTLESYPPHKVIFCDGGSTDRSCELIKEKGYKIIEKTVKHKSLWKTICLAKNHIDTEFVWIHPVTVEAPEVLAKLQSYFQEGKDYGWFHKIYLEKNWPLSIQAFLLNKLRSKWKGNFLWTNAPIIQTDLFRALTNLKKMRETEGVLEDVILSDYLKKHYDGQFMKIKIHVNPRRYLTQGVLNRICKNIKALYLYRYKRESPHNLRELLASP